ncbi:MAG: endonuclease domain-containing protein [Candidatus Kerfeldbacteria bacterium]|nr:endonuclease domain-containing protein [Candidatus Kerfeldbacteria bacterium]
MPSFSHNRSRRTRYRRELRRNSTLAEWRLWWYLRDRRFHSLKFRRQHHIGSFIVDFYCGEARLVVEVDGDSHFEEGALERDRTRDAWLQAQGYKVTRLTNDEVLVDTEMVLKKLARFVRSSPNLSSPR